MRIDKFSDDRLFQNNTREEISRWCKALQYFHYMRARGGHNCEGDSFCVYFKYDGREDLIGKLNDLGVNLNTLDEDSLAFDPFESYSFEDLDKLKMVIPAFNDLEQPQFVEVFGHKVHIWVMDRKFEISVSGTKDGKAYRVSDDDFDVCSELEKQFDKLEWKSILDNEIVLQIHCISKDNYPELYE